MSNDNNSDNTKTVITETNKEKAQPPASAPKEKPQTRSGGSSYKSWDDDKKKDK